MRKLVKAVSYHLTDRTALPSRREGKSGCCGHLAEQIKTLEVLSTFD